MSEMHINSKGRTIWNHGKEGGGDDNSQNNYEHLQSQIAPYGMNTIWSIHAQCL